MAYTRQCMHTYPSTSFGLLNPQSLVPPRYAGQNVCPPSYLLRLTPSFFLFHGSPGRTQPRANLAFRFSPLCGAGIHSSFSSITFVRVIALGGPTSSFHPHWPGNGVFFASMCRYHSAMHAVKPSWVLSSMVGASSRKPK